MNNLKATILLTAFLCSMSCVWAQVPGFIYKQSTNSTIRAVLDPNGDGYISTSTSGFIGTDYGTQSELKMIPLPMMGAEPTGDVSTGGSGGHTDIVSGNTPSNQSVYILQESGCYILFDF